MLKIVKLGGLTVGAGVLLGLGGVGWLRLHQPEKPLANSNGGSVLLDPGSTPVPTPDGGLKVVNASENASGGGQSLINLGGATGGQTSNSTDGSGSGSSSASSSGSGSSSVPGPAEFGQYDKYAGSATAMFGDLRKGDGQEAAAGNTLVVQYRGWLTNGTQFDETYSSGKSFSFVEGDHRVIPGWEEGLLGMKAGGKRRLIVPPTRGYGAEAHGPIPADSVLVFDIELLEVK